MSSERISQSSPLEAQVNEKVTVEVSVGSLYPILPQQTGRYNVAQRCSQAPACCSRRWNVYGSSHTFQWSAYTHPEGQVYFGRSGDSSLRVVTDSYLYKPEVAEKLVSWVQIIEKEAEALNFNVSESVELYVQLEDEDCNYYFADHVARTLFWLDDYETSALGLLPVVSPSHLKLQLEEHYWTHVEYHSMHGFGFHSNVVEEAISDLISGCGDHLTSNTSTFPYSREECKAFLDMLVPARDRPLNGRILSLTARILNVIASNRYFTHYGQEQARLCRDNAILDSGDSTAEAGPTWANTVASTLTFHSQDFFVDRLNTIFTDNYVYAVDWKQFVKQSMNKWKFAFVQSIALLALHIFAFFLPVSLPLAMASAGSLSLSIVASAILINRHQDMEDSTASEGHAYLCKNLSKQWKFQHLALAFALPQALSLWGLFLMSTQVVTFLQPQHILILSAVSILFSIASVSRSMFVKSRKATSVPPQETSEKSLV
ncbi:hypothetical protein FA13DRAFT_1648550 [Coprinellus micaceus]|uniref:WW domain-containing protein n=1 Tax=Coprinellus micaceus TaxID=71717 RepID=A0A4Y7SAI7_COPMI|nr:hypothetical protein FA13DRAFT_1648550 [Coprinellus micaceus]